MVREEIILGLEVIGTQYKMESHMNFERCVDIWFTIFRTFTFDQFKQAIMSFMANDIYGKFPMPGNVKQYIVIANKKKQREFTEVWAEIYKAMQNSTYHSVESFEKLSIEAKEIVRTPEILKQWAMTEDLNCEVVYSNLNKIYTANCKRNEEIESIPENLRVGIGFEKEEIKKYQAIEDKSDQDTQESKVSNSSYVDKLIADLKKKLSN